MNGIGVLAVIRGVRRKVPKADTDGKENLPTSSLPDGAIAKSPSIPFSKVKLDAIVCVRQRDGTAEDNDHHDYRQAHGEVDNSSCETNALENAEPDKKPHKGAPAYCFSDDTCSRILDIAGTHGCNGIGVLNDIIHVEFIAATRPRQWALEGTSKICHNPGEDRDIVGGHDETGHDDCEAETLGVLVDSIECDDYTSTICLSNTDLEDKSWDAQEEQGDEVGYEPSETVVGKDDRRVAEEVTESDSAALGVLLVMVCLECRR